MEILAESPRHERVTNLSRQVMSANSDSTAVSQDNVSSIGRNSEKAISVDSRGRTATSANASEGEDVHADRGVAIDVSGEKKRVAQGKDEDVSRKKKGASGLHALFRVFRRYSEPIDHVLRLCGFFAACAAGAALPLMTLVWGSSVNQFNSFGAGNSSSSELYHAITKNALWFLYLFIGRLVLVYIHTTCFSITGIRATRSLRQDFLKSLMRQDVAYLDACSPGTVATTVSNNADIIETSIGEKVGTFIMSLSMIVSAFIVAFTQQWKLTLVTTTSLPAIIAGFGLTFKLGMKIHSFLLLSMNC